MKYKDPQTGNLRPYGTKVEDTLPVGTEVDYDGNDVPEGWEEVDNPNNYSTEETKIGTYLGKPLYRKVIETTAPSTVDTNANIYTFTENIENVVNIYGYLYYQSASYKGSINCYITAQDYIATWILVDTSGIPTNIRCRQHNRISAPMKITLEYTKTTD